MLTQTSASLPLDRRLTPRADPEPTGGTLELLVQQDLATSWTLVVASGLFSLGPLPLLVLEPSNLSVGPEVCLKALGQLIPLHLFLFQKLF